MNDKHYIGKSVDGNKLTRGWAKGYASWGGYGNGSYVVILEVGDTGGDALSEENPFGWTLWAITDYDDNGNWYIKRLKRSRYSIGKSRDKVMKKFPPDIEKQAEVVLKSVISKKLPVFDSVKKKRKG